MDILIIGGTRFYGRAFTELALKNGHRVTLFHRGQSNPDIFPEAQRILGDRATDLEKLGDAHWDAVLDTCGQLPRHVRDAAEYLKNRVNHYVYVSSISAYVDGPEIGKDETAELQQLPEGENPDEFKLENYGALKVLCERAAEETMPARTTLVRPGLIVGPHDATNRFTYWPVRVSKGGDVLVPGDGTMPCQIIDARDLAAFTLNLIENRIMGIFNATGPDKPLALQEILETSKTVSGSDANFIYTDEAWLQEKEVGAWMEMPLWIPDEAGKALMQVSIQHGLANGLKFRSLEETIRDTLAWYNDIKGDEKDWPAGMKSEKENTLLAEYKARTN